MNHVTIDKSGCQVDTGNLKLSHHHKRKRTTYNISTILSNRFNCIGAFTKLYKQSILNIKNQSDSLKQWHKEQTQQQQQKTLSAAWKNDMIVLSFVCSRKCKRAQTGQRHSSLLLSLLPMMMAMEMHVHCILFICTF